MGRVLSCGRRAYLRLGEAAAILSVSHDTVERLVASGELACDRSPKGQLRFTLRHLADYLDRLAARAAA